MTHRDTPPMAHHLIAAARRRNSRPLLFHNNRGGSFCPGHRGRRAASAALRTPSAGPVDVCLAGPFPPWGRRPSRIIVSNHSFEAGPVPCAADACPPSIRAECTCRREETP